MIVSRDLLRTYIVENFLFGDDEGLEDSTSFLETGMIDSTGILQLISFLEENFPLKIKDEELIPENLDSIASIMDFVRRKLGTT